MFKNSLFAKIVMIFTIPVLGIFFFSSMMVYEKIKLAKEVNKNSSRLEYLRSAGNLILSLENEKLLSLEYFDSKNNLKKLKFQQETSDSLFKKLNITISNMTCKDLWKEHLDDLAISFNELDYLRVDINDSSLIRENISEGYFLLNKSILKTLFSLKFTDFRIFYQEELLKIEEYFNTNLNQVDKLKSHLEFIIYSIENELMPLKSKAALDKNLSLFYMLLCFFTLIPLFFVLKEIIFKQEEAFIKIQKHKNIYELLNQANKFLSKFIEKDELFIDICELLNENKDLKFCFIYDVVNKKIVVKNGNLKEEILKFSDKFQDFSKQNLISKTVKIESNVVINDFREKNMSVFFNKAKEFNINSMATFPIKKFNEVVGVLVLYSHYLNFFDQEVEILFGKLVIDITSCLEKVDYERIKENQEQELKLSSFAFDFSSPMIITDDKNTIVKVNQAFCKMMGYSRSELIGENPRIFKTGHQDKEFIERLWNDLKVSGYWSGDVYNRKSTGDIIALRSNITAIKDQNDEVTNYLAQYMDISEHKDKEKILEYQATHDNLTGLPNRLLLIDRIEHAITKTVRHKIFGGLIFIDLDNFKEVNDTLGHDTGDILLITVAKKIKDCLRDEDTVSRIGGDEFIVLIDNIGNNSTDARNNITYLAEKIKDALNSITHINGHINVSTPSIGITLFNDASVGVQDIIKQADTAMYSAKKQGKNAIEFF